MFWIKGWAYGYRFTITDAIMTMHITTTKA